MYVSELDRNRESGICHRLLLSNIYYFDLAP